MQVLRKLGSGILFVLALLGFVLALAGIFGVFWARASIDQLVVDVTTLSSETATRANEAVADVDARLVEAETVLANVRDRAALVATEGPSSPSAQALQRAINEDLGPRIDRIVGAAVALNATVEAYNETVRRVNRTPGVNLPQIDVDQEAIGASVVTISTQAAEIRTALASLDGSRIRALAEQLNTRIAEARIITADVSAGISAAEAWVIQLGETLNFWANVGATVLPSLLVLFAAGQVSLAAHAWRWLRA